MLPGDSLHNLLDRLGYPTEPGCRCLEHIAQMNTWGKVKCREELDTIVGWLEAEAKERGEAFPPKRMVAAFVRYAIWRAD